MHGVYGLQRIKPLQPLVQYVASRLSYFTPAESLFLLSVTVPWNGTVKSLLVLLTLIPRQQGRNATHQRFVYEGKHI